MSWKAERLSLAGVALLAGAAAFAQPASPPPAATTVSADPSAPDDDPQRIQDAAAHHPVLSTAKTLADPAALAELQTPGRILFTDGFESPEALKAAFEVLGQKEGRAKVVSDAKLAHTGTGALQLTTPANDGKSVGAGPSYWFGPEGHDRVHLRYYIRFADDYDQGDLNHTGGGLAAVSGEGKWDQMGKAGIRPKGDDRFTVGFEPWKDWGRNAAPGAMALYVYWPDMKRDRDGNFWGNLMMPEAKDRVIPERGRWYCFEQMIKANTPGKPDGELAAWIDGKLYAHYTGFRWRTSDKVKLKRFNLAVYIHKSTRENTVWYDDVVLSTGYIGPSAEPRTPPEAPKLVK